MFSVKPEQQLRYSNNDRMKHLLLFSMKTSGRYEKPLSGSKGLPQLACSPGICRFITVLIPFLDTDTQTENNSLFSSPRVLWVLSLEADETKSCIPFELIDDVILLNDFC